MRLCTLLAAAAAACSGASPLPDAGPPDSGAPDGGATPMTATMSLFETAGDAGVRLEAFIAVHAGLTHDYDDGTCTVDRSRPADADAAWLRISGYRAAGQPIVCMNEDG